MTDEKLRFLNGGGHMGELMRSFNWAETPLGLPETWPDSLKSAVSISLNSGFPIGIYWGKDFTLLYNDAWSTIPGQKHPWALGKPGAVVWPEIWEGLIDQFESVLNTGESIRQPDGLLLMHRYGYTEECYFDYTLSPIVAADGSVGGVFNAVIETSYRVINDRRNKIIQQFLQSSHQSRHENEAVSRLFSIIESGQADIPFGFLYTGKDAKLQDIELAGSFGAAQNIEASAWPFTPVLDGLHVVIENLGDFLSEPVINVWPDPVCQAVIVPISKDDARIRGFMVLGVSSRKRLDDHYLDFLKAVGMHAGAILNNAYAHEVGEAFEREQALNEELAASNEELFSTIEQLSEAQESLNKLNNELEEKVDERTAEVLAAQRRTESERDRLSRFLMEAPAGIAVLHGDDMVFELVNPLYQQLLPGRKLLGRPIGEALPELKNQPIWDILQRVYQTGETFDGRELYVPLSVYEGGPVEDRFFNFVYQARYDENYKVDGISVFCFDVTEQVISRKKTEASEKRLQFILNAIPQQVWTAEPNGRLNYVNNVVCNNLGYDAEQIVDFGWRRFVHPDDLPLSLKKWENSLKTGDEYLAEFRLEMKNGEYRWHLSRAQAYYEDGRITLWLGANTDIELQKSNEQKKDEFLSIASHELKTPLTSIKAFNQLMKRTTDPDKLTGFIQKSEHHIFRLEKLIHDLLDVTKINAGKLVYNMQAFNFGQMLLNSIESIRHIAPAFEIILNNAPDITYTGDEYRLEQVMHNFLTNAVKYSPEGRKVIVNCEVTGDAIITSVQDFGIGIAKEHLERLFDRYYRVDSTAMRFEGLGLGLFISSVIVNRHNGTCWIESEEGNGSTFYFSLPLT
ncbi:PAS domain S-box protein [Mucilaginibacter limnophilus]|uniref:histidine kinase n=1 Tax=Mucilaginibacter limnophilus TaxID=1932778 RepID=A0A437MFP5_9SPHI|nr:ATP-binding protein [Mucilaginibacter limnophilus]RVT96490.1 PAS domain S-box protein [Mucilaginibacter limnophilus]